MQLSKPLKLESALQNLIKHSSQRNSISQDELQFWNIFIKNLSKTENRNEQLILVRYIFSKILKTEIKIFITEEAFSKDEQILLMVKQPFYSRTDDNYQAFLVYNEADSNYYSVFSRSDDQTKTTFDPRLIYEAASPKTNELSTADGTIRGQNYHLCYEISELPHGQETITSEELSENVQIIDQSDQVYTYYILKCLTESENSNKTNRSSSAIIQSSHQTPACATDNSSTAEDSPTSIQNTIGSKEDNTETENLMNSSEEQQQTQSPENLISSSTVCANPLKLAAPKFLSDPKSPVKPRYLTDLVLKNEEETNKDEGMASETTKKRRRGNYLVINRLQSKQGQRKLVSVQLPESRIDGLELACQVVTAEQQVHPRKFLLPEGTRVPYKEHCHDRDLKFLNFDACQRDSSFDKHEKIVYLPVSQEDFRKKEKELNVYLMNGYKNQAKKRKSTSKGQPDSCRILCWFSVKENEKHTRLSESTPSTEIYDR